MRKLVSALAIAAGLTLLAGPAFAQTDRRYPPGKKGLDVSETTVAPGESFTCSGDGAEPGATVTFTLKRSSSALSPNRTLAAGAGVGIGSGTGCGGVTLTSAASAPSSAPETTETNVATREYMELRANP